MRLINVHTLQFRIFLRDQPRYAIASHRWLEAETTFQDFADKKDTNQQGYRKIVDFAEYVRKNVSNVDWLWIDTCCINKDSSTELQEAITSMFRWYRNADICFALLSDVKTPQDAGEFANSVWFTRGWTLQELLASRFVVFLTSKWQVIGHKGTKPVALHNSRLAIGPLLHESISRCTTIPAAVLADYDFARNISSDVKRQWMSGRQTTRDEDKAYALIGILDVSIFINYGEGFARAQRRLLDEVAIMERSPQLNPASIEEAKIWLDSRASLELREELTRCRTENTCQWIIERAESESWAQSERDHRATWVHGNLGLGKSVMTAALVQHFERTLEKPVVSFFCSHNEEALRAPSNILRSCLTQVLAQNDLLLAIIEDFRLQSGHQTATEGDLQSLLSRVTRFGAGIVMVVDGFDECQEFENTRHKQHQYDRGKFLRQLFSVFIGTPSHLILISRDEFDIRDALCFPDQNALHTQVKECEILPEDVQPDLVRFCAQQVDTLGRLSDELRAQVVDHLAKNSDGMFAFARLQGVQLGQARNVAQLRNRMATAPRVLENLWDRHWQAIDDCNDSFEKERIVRALRWVTFAVEPLSALALFEAIALQENPDHEEGLLPMFEISEELLPMRLINERLVRADLLEPCKPFLTLKRNPSHQSWASAKVELVHSTMRPFLIDKLRTRGHKSLSSFQDPVLAELCLGYLAKGVPWEPLAAADPALQLHPFLSYAARNWGRHIDTSHQAFHRAHALRQSFFAPTNGNWEKWRDEHERQLKNSDGPGLRSFATAGRCYYAAAEGANSVLESLLEDSTVDVNALGGEFGTALKIACARGFEKTAELLLLHGAVPTLSGTADESTAVHIAAAADGPELINLLIPRRPVGLVDDVVPWQERFDIRDAQLRTPLIVAAVNERHASMAHLIHVGVDLDCQDSLGRTALYHCVKAGQQSLVEELLSNGADSTLTDLDGISPLHIAVSQSDVTLVTSLVKAGASTEGCFAEAIRNGNFELIGALLMCSGDPNLDLPVERGQAPLEIAVMSGHVDIVERLLEGGASANVVDMDGCPLLWRAVNSGHSDISELLLKAGVKSDAVNYRIAKSKDPESLLRIVSGDFEDSPSHNHDRGRTALTIAAARNDAKVVRSLLSAGADPDIADFGGWKPLPVALRKAHSETARVLISAGAQIDTPSPDGIPSLFLAVKNSDHGCIRALVDAKIDVNFAADAKLTALHVAATRGDVETMEILTKAGADRNATAVDGSTALHMAADHGHLRMVQVLLDDLFKLKVDGCDSAVLLDASVECGIHRQTTDSRCTPLHFAVCGGHHQLVEMLIAVGANVHTIAARGWTAVHMAASRGHYQALEILLKAGAHAGMITEDGISALQAAAHGGHLKATEVLAEHVMSGDNGGSEVCAALVLARAAGFDNIPKAMLRILKWKPQQSLWDAVRLGDAPTVTALLDDIVEDDVVDVDQVDESGRTLLGAAVELGHTSVVKALLEAGARCDDLTPDLRLAWDVAFRNHRYDGIELLSDARARAEHPFIVSSASLYAAAVCGDMQTVSLQLAEGCPLEILRNVSTNPLLAAQKAGHSAIVECMLLERWMNAFQDRDQLGRYWSHVVGASGLRSSLINSINQTDKQLWTPLHWAAYFGHRELCESLVEAGANVGAKDQQGWTPAQVARFAGYQDLATSIRPHRFSRLGIAEIEPWSEYGPKWHCDACTKVSFSISLLSCLKSCIISSPCTCVMSHTK
jgi:ankyrin repeat protein